MEFQPNVITPVSEPEGPKPSRQPIEGLPGVSKDLPIDERPLALVETPVLVDIFEADAIYKGDIDGAKNKINIIDALIKAQMEEMNWQPVVKSYKDMAEKIFTKLNVDKNETPLSKVDKVYDILKNVLEDKKMSKKLGVKLQSINIT